MVKAAAAKGPTPEEREATRELLAKAKDLIKAVDNSDFCKEHSVSRHYPVFDHTEIATGPVLGFGGFGVVYEVEEFILKDSGSNDTATLEHLEVPEDDLPVFETDKAGAASDSGEVQDDTLEHAHYEVSTARKFMVANVRRHGVDARYAIKCLREDLSALHRARGMIDMVIETKLLSRLWHPNIVKMRGYSTGPMYHADFFFVMDRLYETLDQKIQLWSEELHPNGKSGVLAKVFGPRGIALKQKQEVEHDVMLQRLVVAYDLASAFSYMHQNKLVYRDVKQENIGFDVRGDVKVFDFGLCKGLSPALRAKDKKTGAPVYGYNLTPRTGSLPYLAPEVVESRPYGCKCDVFSFAILAWEIFALKDAFKGITKGEFLNRVARNKERPPVPRKLKPLTKLMLKEAWDHEPAKRPEMKRVALMIRADLNDMSGGDDSILHRTKHMLDRSNRSMRLQQRGPARQSSHG